MLNILSKGDISKESYDDIVSLCRICSWGSTRNKSQVRDTFKRVQNIANRGATREKFCNLLEGFKTEILSSLRRLRKNRLKQSWLWPFSIQSVETNIH